MNILLPSRQMPKGGGYYIYYIAKITRTKNCCCHFSGHYVRDICIYGMKDLPWIIKKNSMFANKFESTTCPEALDCLEQWHRNKVLNEADVPIEPSWLLAMQRNSSSSYFSGTAEA